MNRPLAPRDSVFVRGLEFEGNHGYTAAERRGTRRFRVSIALYAQLNAAARSDKLADTIDYWKVSEIIVGVGTQSTFKLLEALAGAMASKIQQLYPRAELEIEIEKLAPPCPGVPQACGVRLQFPAAA
ncbi:MAG TPA: dihydroneopterin aldolase [Kofleriaceae bacterium]|nr:dihydroneopterin aldolase [Kofleriaceae bacterium]